MYPDWTYGDDTKAQQDKHCEAFIEDCRQKSWGAPCNANWIGQELEKLANDYAKLQKDVKLSEEIHAVESAVETVAAALAERGFLTPSGHHYSASAVASMLY